MSAAPSIRCPHCDGNPARYDWRCPRCGDEGRVELAACPVEDAPRLVRAIRYVQERAAERMPMALRNAGAVADRESIERLGPHVAYALAHGVEVGKVVAFLIERFRLEEREALSVIAVYVHAAREQAVAFRRCDPHRGTLRETSELDALVCEAHADRIERALPKRLRAVA